MLARGVKRWVGLKPRSWMLAAGQTHPSIQHRSRPSRRIVAAAAPWMAAADTAMVLAVMTKLGGFKPMTTVQLQTSFLRQVAGTSGSARVVARVLRMGRSLVFGEVQILNADDELAAHATTTYALL